jgi:protein-S-isoprenylcysteine O-methyltransferase Ste14
VLSDLFVKHGRWLFRWRSYLPLLLAPIIVGAMLRFAYPHGSLLMDDLWETVCALTTLVGIAVRVYTVGHAPWGTSGRTTKRQAAKSLNVTGAYSVLRHPLYLGNFFIWLGIAMATLNLTVVIVFTLAFWLYYERIMMAEEAFLLERFGDRFKDWAARTPAFLPKPSLWVPPAHAFSWRRVVRSEYTGVFAVIAIFTLIEVIGDSAAGGATGIEPGWAVLFGLGAVAYLAIMYAKRGTHLLDP